ncbi:RraA-like protein [Cladochytrium replicatum]|nr:RraA-like protein [Cladochytrium replicatum]
MVVPDFPTCDIADALQKLGIPSFISTVELKTSRETLDAARRVLGRAHTARFVAASDTATPTFVSTEGPSPSPHVDFAPEGSILVLQVPRVQPNAVFGGLMAARARVRGVRGVVIEGRCRDLDELDEIGAEDPPLPVFASATSVHGAGGFVRLAEVGQPVTLAQETHFPVVINEGDWIVADRDGVVRVPANKVEEVVALCQKSIAADGMCMVDIRAGVSIAAAFKAHRGN